MSIRPGVGGSEEAVGARGRSTGEARTHPYRQGLREPTNHDQGGTGRSWFQRRRRWWRDRLGGRRRSDQHMELPRHSSDQGQPAVEDLPPAVLALVQVHDPGGVLRHRVRCSKGRLPAGHLLAARPDVPDRESPAGESRSGRVRDPTALRLQGWPPLPQGHAFPAVSGVLVARRTLCRGQIREPRHGDDRAEDPPGSDDCDVRG